MNRYATMVALVVGRIVDDSDARADVIQDTWIRVWRSLDAYRGSHCSSTWVYVIARRCALNALRDSRLRHRREAAAARALTQSDDSLHDPFVRERVQDVIRTLPPRQRAVLLAYDVGGCTHSEIAGWLGCTPNTSRTQLLKARRALRRRITRDGTYAGISLPACRVPSHENKQCLTASCVSRNVKRRHSDAPGRARSNA